MPEVKASGIFYGAWYNVFNKSEFMENYVVMELVKNYAYAKSKVNITYFRDFNAKEIDVFVEENNVIHPYRIICTFARPQRSANMPVAGLQRRSQRLRREKTRCQACNENDFLSPLLIRSRA